MKLRTALRTFASRSWAARTDCSRSGFKPRHDKDGGAETKPSDLAARIARAKKRQWLRDLQ